jgi:uncharacterized protein (TIGR03118 family)
MEAPMRLSRHAMVTLSGLALLVSLSPAAVGAGVNSFQATILDSDGVVPALNPTPDPNLKNPWGFGFSNTSPFWTGNQATGTTTLYAAPLGAPNNTVGPVTIPGGGSPNGPTGVVNNGANVGGDGVTGTGFTIIGQTPTANPASFIFDNLNGTISAWNGGIGNHGTAIVQVTTPGASYTGLAIANNGSQDLLYAADNAAGAGHAMVAVFGQATTTSAWAPVTLTGNNNNPFTNPQTSAAPYNIQFLNGKLYVVYQTGSVGIFDLNGNFLSGFTDTTHLRSPWGITIAPATFPAFGGDLLVGNRGNGVSAPSGQIAAYDPNSFAFLGFLQGPNGQPLAFPGLWALAFRTSGFDPNTLYFTAGVGPLGGNFYSDGIFGAIAVPEPASVLLLGLGLIAVGGVYRGRAIVMQKVLGRDRCH